MPPSRPTFRCHRPLALVGLVWAILFGALPADVLAHAPSAQVAAGAPSAQVTAGASPARVTAGDTYQAVRGLGPTKRAAKNLLRVKLRDDTSVVTHGLERSTAFLQKPFQITELLRKAREVLDS